MSTLHYDAANYDIERANRSAEWTDAGQAEANLLARAQVHATLALVDAIRDQASKTPEAGDDNSPSAPAPASGPLPGQCANCGHNADVHDGEGGHCSVLVDNLRIMRCYCYGFEARS